VALAPGGHHQVAWYWANSDADYLHAPGAECEGREESCRWIHPVGQKEANPLGIFDTSGNVAEITWGKYYHAPDDEYRDQLSFDPGHLPILRPDDVVPQKGGHFRTVDVFVCTRSRRGFPVQCALEDPSLPETCESYVYRPVGFRLVRTLLDE